MSLTLPLAAQPPSQLSHAHPRTTAAPALRLTVVGLVAWVALTALLATALIALDVFATEGLQRALDGLGPVDATTVLGFTS